MSYMKAHRIANIVVSLAYIHIFIIRFEELEDKHKYTINILCMLKIMARMVFYCTKIRLYNDVLTLAKTELSINWLNGKVF